MNCPTALSYYLKHHPDALNDLVKHFGPNYAAVLNFWAYLDTLTGEQIKSIKGVYLRSVSLEDYAGKIVKHQCDVWESSRFFGQEPHKTKFYNPSVLGYATLELVAMHDILNDGHKLNFIPRFDNL